MAEIDQSTFPIFAIAEREWPATQNDCNAFVRAVARNLGITLTGIANELVAFWEQLQGGISYMIASLLPRMPRMGILSFQESQNGFTGMLSLLSRVDHRIMTQWASGGPSGPQARVVMRDLARRGNADT